MKLTSLLAIPVFFALIVSVPADTPVEVVGVQIVQKAYGEKEFQMLVPFNSFKTGIEIGLGFSMKDGGIIKIDEDASVLETFADDKGTNLIVKDFGRQGFGPFPKRSEDGKAGIISLASSKLPAAGATEVTAKGKIAMTTASTKKAERSKIVELKKGATLTLGKINFKVVKVEGKGETKQISLETNDSIDALAEVRFIGENNAKLETERRGSGSMGFAGKKTYSIDYEIKEASAKVIMEADLWQDVKQVFLPFDIAVKLPMATSK